MADDKRTLETPRGEARYLVLGQEEVIKGKPTGKQGGSIVFKGAALEKITEEVESFIEDSFPAKRAKAVIRPFKTGKDGEVFLNARAYYKTKEGEIITIPVFDRNGKPVKNPPRIGNGSTIRLKVMLRPSEFGGKDYVNVGLRAVKLIKLVEFSGSGFSSEDEDEDDEDGFDADAYASADQGNDEGHSGSSGDDFDDDDVPF